MYAITSAVNISGPGLRIQSVIETNIKVSAENSQNIVMKYSIRII